MKSQNVVRKYPIRAPACKTKGTKIGPATGGKPVAGLVQGGNLMKDNRRYSATPHVATLR